MAAKWRVGVGLVVVGVGLMTGCSRRDEEPAAAAARSRYDCLIIRNLTGKDDMVTTRGFPECFAPEALAAEPAGATPAANIEAPSLGTTVRVAVYGMDEKRADAAARGALARIEAELGAVGGDAFVQPTRGSKGVQQ